MHYIDENESLVEADINTLLSYNISDKIMDIYAAGRCHILAFVLNNLIPNSSLVSVLDYDMDIEMYVITHTFIKTNKEYYIDIKNITKDINKILEEYEELNEYVITTNLTRDEIQSYAGKCREQEYKNAEPAALKLYDLYRLLINSTK